MLERGAMQLLTLDVDDAPRMRDLDAKVREPAYGSGGRGAAASGRMRGDPERFSRWTAGIFQYIGCTDACARRSCLTEVARPRSVLVNHTGYPPLFFISVDSKGL